MSQEPNATADWLRYRTTFPTEWIVVIVLETSQIEALNWGQEHTNRSCISVINDLINKIQKDERKSHSEKFLISTCILTSSYRLR